jgi:hypothetical protein
LNGVRRLRPSSFLRRAFYLALVCVGAFILLDAVFFRKPEREPFADSFDLRNGDVVFIRGRTWRSLLVRLAETSCDFSHVGIVRIVDGAPYVVHAAPEAKTVLLESAADFLSPSNVDSAGVYRLKRDPRRAEEASRNALRYFERKIPFDRRFDIRNGDELYCTELVWLAFKSVGVDLEEGAEGFLYDSKIYGEVLLPQALLRGRLSRVSDM